jgi:hypothetical protein
MGRRIILRFAALVGALAAAGLAGCGPSRAEVRTARRSVYQTEFAVVWNAVVATVSEQVPRFAIEDPTRGQLVSDWFLVERINFDQEDGPGGGATNKGSGGATTGNGPVGPAANASGPQTVTPTGGGLPNVGGVFLRFIVDIRPGGPPWRVEVDGEAALYRPGMALITPYRHGAADEPSWVGPRIDKVRVGIYRALKPHARILQEAPKAKVARDDSRWQNLPAKVVPVVGAVHAAADKKDLPALAQVMSPGFVWSVAGTPGLEAALAFWRADPPVLAKLRDVLAAGCAARNEGQLVVCPVTADQPGTWRAEFTAPAPGTSTDAWQFSAFYLNE